MEFRLLGPVELWAAGTSWDLGSAKERCVLVGLLLTPRMVVPTETLIRYVWGMHPPLKARQDLATYVSRIRRRLQKAVANQAHVARKADGYLLDTDPQAIDLHQFMRRVRDARAGARGGHLEEAVQLLRDAEGLWAGPALGGLKGDWAAGIRQTLEEERRAALLERVHLELELGRHAAIVGELRGLADQYGLDEAFIACEMKALYLSGRLADALTVYSRARRRLVEEQGAEPGPELADLHQRILRRAPELGIYSSTASPGPVPVDTLPAGASDFVGRVDEITRLTTAVASRSLPHIEIIEGMAGVGKTALAIHVARWHANQQCDGALYLNFLAHVPGQPPLPVGEAAQRLLRMIGVPDTRIPSSHAERYTLWHAELTRRRLAVVFDDVGELRQVQPLLPRSADGVILITSRNRLPGIRGADTLILGLLPADDALAMFAGITGAGRIKDRAVADEAVRLCAGLPLAIHVVAARLRQAPSLSVAELVEKLSPGIGHPGQVVAANDQLTQAFEISYLALAPSERRVFRRLGVHPCTEITADTAAAADGTSRPVAEQALRTLLHHHLLDETAPGRFRCHDLVRAYAMSLAMRDDPEPKRREAVCQVLDHYLYTADRADRIRYPHQYRPSLPASRSLAAMALIETSEAAHRWLEAEWRNMLEAARHAGEHEWQWHCAGFAQVLAGFLDASGYWHDALGLHEAGLQACRALGDPRETARASLKLSHASQQLGHYEKATEHAEEAAAIYRSLGDRRGQAEALDRLGMIHGHSSDYAQALAYYQEARGAYRSAGDRHGVADTLLHAGIACWCLGRPREAITQLYEALDIYRLMEDRRGEAKALNNIGVIQQYRGFHRDALKCYEQSLAIFREIGGRQNQAQLYHNMGRIYQYKGDIAKALVSYRHALATYRDIGDLLNQADVLNEIGTAYQFAGRHQEALANHRQAFAIAEAIGNRHEQVIALRGAADAQCGSGHHAEAVQLYHRVLKLAREVGDPYQEAKILNGIAEAVADVNGRDAARIYWWQALDIFRRLGVPEAESVKLRLQAAESS